MVSALRRTAAGWGGARSGPAVRSVTGLVLLVLALELLLHDQRPPAGEFVFGALIGVLYALVAFGLILIYRATRIINFAQAEFGSVAALLGMLLIKLHHFPYLAALGISVVAAMLTGALTEMVVIRRFAKAPRLVLSVATIGLALLFGLLQFYLPKWLGGGFIVDPNPPRTPLSGLTFYINPLHFNGNAVAIPVVAGAVMVGLTWFFRHTDTGIAVRASAENADRARLLGVSVNRLSLVVWVLAAVLSAISVFLRIPLVGIPVGADIGPGVLLFPLAAAVIARMESFTVALAAGIGIGMTEQCFYYFSKDPDLPQALILPVLLVAMLVQRSRSSRGQDTGLATWSLSAEFRPVPPELRQAPEVAWTRFGGAAALVAALVALPYIADYHQQLLSSVVVIYAIVTVSLVVLTGWAGQISLGQWGFAGVGAAVASGVGIHLRNTAYIKGDFFVALILAGLVGAAVSVVIGLPALRISGLYLAVTTMSFALAIQVYVLSPQYFPWLLPSGLEELPRPFLYGHYSLAGPRAFYFFCLIVLGLALASARALRNSRAGRVIVGARDNERGVQSYGVSVPLARLSAFAISGFWASIAGALFAYQEQNVVNAAFPLDTSFLLLTIAVIGGLTSLPGAMLGALYIGVLEYGGFSQTVQTLASGVGVLLLLYFFPGGLAQIAYGTRDNLLRYVARRRGILVPSLVADSSAAEAPEAGDAGALSRAASSVENREEPVAVSGG